MNKQLRLGVNVDHVATIRNARGTPYPDPLKAALMAEGAGADSITAHLREDRRHITDADIERLATGIGTHLNMEMAVTAEMLRIATSLRPRDCCLVPERREELTTEGGLDVANNTAAIGAACTELAEAGIRVSLFIDAEPVQIESARAAGAAAIEIHTGRYADLDGDARVNELQRIRAGAALAAELGLAVNAGHGLTTDNVAPIAAMTDIEELNIGHALISDAVLIGITRAVAEMKTIMTAARQQ